VGQNGGKRRNKGNAENHIGNKKGGENARWPKKKRKEAK
jgi:hypothetical protein